VDLGFVTISDLERRAALRRCFVTFAVAFRENEWLQIGRGIPRSVLIRLFSTVLSGAYSRSSGSPKNEDSLTAESALDMLETMNLIQKARHDATLLAGPTTKNNANTVTTNESPTPIVAQTLGTGRMDNGLDCSLSISRNQTTKVLHESASYLMYDSVSIPFFVKYDWFHG
jgi:hypothetical protein